MTYEPKDFIPYMEVAKQNFPGIKDETVFKNWLSSTVSAPASTEGVPESVSVREIVDTIYRITTDDRLWNIVYRVVCLIDGGDMPVMNDVSFQDLADTPEGIIGVIQAISMIIEIIKYLRGM